MQPIQDLLNRIRWDAEFAKAEFTLGYYDRVCDGIVRVPMRQVQFVPGDHYFFRVLDAEGALHEVPLHRVREVYRNGELIWFRDL